MTEIESRIAAYELAFRMQTSVPELTDFRDETKETLDLYGVKQPGDGSFASNCLMARRLAERGVRFIQLYHRGWDQHYNLPSDLRLQAQDVDQPCAALIRDLRPPRPTRYKPRRWVVERTLAWLSMCRGILIRWEKKSANYLGMLKLACGLIWFRRYHRLADLR